MGGVQAVSAEFSEEQQEKKDNEKFCEGRRLVVAARRRDGTGRAPELCPGEGGFCSTEALVSALALSDLHLNAAASVYLLSAELALHDCF